jgi:hypothetical protein
MGTARNEAHPSNALFPHPLQPVRGEQLDADTMQQVGCILTHLNQRN